MYRLILTNANKNPAYRHYFPPKKVGRNAPDHPLFPPYRLANGLTSYRNSSKKGVVGSADFCKSTPASGTDLSSLNKNSAPDFFRGGGNFLAPPRGALMLCQLSLTAFGDAKIAKKKAHLEKRALLADVDLVLGLQPIKNIGDFFVAPVKVIVDGLKKSFIVFGKDFVAKQQNDN